METAKQISSTILEQLGGNKFCAMTGAKNFLFAEITETNNRVWLRMDLGRNAGKVNRLKIYYNSDDTYSMHFYNQQIRNYTEVKISNETQFENVYSDQLRELFTQVTGMHTSLGTMGR